MMAAAAATDDKNYNQTFLHKFDNKAQMMEEGRKGETKHRKTKKNNQSSFAFLLFVSSSFLLLLLF